MRSEAVDYFQQDSSSFANGQAAETMALVIDTTAAEHDMQAMQHLLKKVLFQAHCIIVTHMSDKIDVSAGMCRTCTA